MRIGYLNGRWAHVQMIFDFIEIPGAVASDTAELYYQQQSEALNNLWVERFDRIYMRKQGMHSLYWICSLPRWISLQALSRYRAARRGKRLPTGERLEPR